MKRVARNRRSIRLPSYDYSAPGAYFITIVTKDRERLFGNVQDTQIHLNEYGEIVFDEWSRSAELRREIELDAFVVMPNHLHGIIVLTDVGARRAVPLPESFGKPVTGSVPTIVRSFKSASTKRINHHRNTGPVSQFGSGTIVSTAFEMKRGIEPDS